MDNKCQFSSPFDTNLSQFLHFSSKETPGLMIGSIFHIKIKKKWKNHTAFGYHNLFFVYILLFVQLLGFTFQLVSGHPWWTESSPMQSINLTNQRAMHPSVCIIIINYLGYVCNIFLSKFFYCKRHMHVTIWLVLLWQINGFCYPALLTATTYLFFCLFSGGV
jgi:hypothetical protein